MGGDDEIIPTAIVIKNIPFNVKRETLLDIIVRIFFFSCLPRAPHAHSPRCTMLMRRPFS